MKFALVDNTRVEPQPKQQGLCPNCFQSVIAKCGSQKIWHWAHRNIKSCDSWWEQETEWHRKWKNKYPSEWQEIVFFEKETNVRHIADIRTIHNLIIEFQHSAISSEERISREMFYKEMIWVIDGTRMKRDYARFSKATKNFIATEKKGIYLIENIDDIFPTNWLSSTVPVIFDFKRLDDLIEVNDRRNNLYCLLPFRLSRYSVLAEIPREKFIGTTIDGTLMPRIKDFMLRLTPNKDQSIQNQDRQISTRTIEGTHYLDPKKGVFKKRWRF